MAYLGLVSGVYSLRGSGVRCWSLVYKGLGLGVSGNLFRFTPYGSSHRLGALVGSPQNNSYSILSALRGPCSWKCLNSLNTVVPNRPHFKL